MAASEDVDIVTVAALATGAVDGRAAEKRAAAVRLDVRTALLPDLANMTHTLASLLSAVDSFAEEEDKTASVEEGQASITRRFAMMDDIRGSLDVYNSFARELEAGDAQSRHEHPCILLLENIGYSPALIEYLRAPESQAHLGPRLFPRIASRNEPLFLSHTTAHILAFAGMWAGGAFPLAGRWTAGTLSDIVLGSQILSYANRDIEKEGRIINGFLSMSLRSTAVGSRGQKRGHENSSDDGEPSPKRTRVSKSDISYSAATIIFAILMYAANPKTPTTAHVPPLTFKELRGRVHHRVIEVALALLGTQTAARAENADRARGSRMVLRVRTLLKLIDLDSYTATPTPSRAAIFLAVAGEEGEGANLLAPVPEDMTVADDTDSASPTQEARAIATQARVRPGVMALCEAFMATCKLPGEGLSEVIPKVLVEVQSWALALYSKDEAPPATLTRPDASWVLPTLGLIIQHGTAETDNLCKVLLESFKKDAESRRLLLTGRKSVPLTSLLSRAMWKTVNELVQINMSDETRKEAEALASVGFMAEALGTMQGSVLSGTGKTPHTAVAAMRYAREFLGVKPSSSDEWASRTASSEAMVEWKSARVAKSMAMIHTGVASKAAPFVLPSIYRPEVTIYPDALMTYACAWGALHPTAVHRGYLSPQEATDLVGAAWLCVRHNGLTKEGKLGEGGTHPQQRLAHTLASTAVLTVGMPNGQLTQHSATMLGYVFAASAQNTLAPVTAATASDVSFGKHVYDKSAGTKIDLLVDIATAVALLEFTNMDSTGKTIVASLPPPIPPTVYPLCVLFAPESAPSDAPVQLTADVARIATMNYCTQRLSVDNPSRFYRILLPSDKAWAIYLATPRTAFDLAIRDRVRAYAKHKLADHKLKAKKSKGREGTPQKETDAHTDAQIFSTTIVFVDSPGPELSRPQMLMSLAQQMAAPFYTDVNRPFMSCALAVSTCSMQSLTKEDWVVVLAIHRNYAYRQMMSIARETGRTMGGMTLRRPNLRVHCTGPHSNADSTMSGGLTLRTAVAARSALYHGSEKEELPAFLPRDTLTHSVGVPHYGAWLPTNAANTIGWIMFDLNKYEEIGKAARDAVQPRNTHRDQNISRCAILKVFGPHNKPLAYDVFPGPEGDELAYPTFPNTRGIAILVGNKANNKKETSASVTTVKQVEDLRIVVGVDPSVTTIEAVGKYLRSLTGQPPIPFIRLHAHATVSTGASTRRSVAETFGREMHEEHVGISGGALM